MIAFVCDGRETEEESERDRIGTDLASHKSFALSERTPLRDGCFGTPVTGGRRGWPQASFFGRFIAGLFLSGELNSGRHTAQGDNSDRCWHVLPSRKCVA